MSGSGIVSAKTCLCTCSLVPCSVQLSKKVDCFDLILNPDRPDCGTYGIWHMEMEYG